MDDETTADIADGIAGLLWSTTRLELTTVVDELLISLLDIDLDDGRISVDVETTADLADDIAGVLWSIARLESIAIDGEAPNDDNLNDETTADLTDENVDVLS